MSNSHTKAINSYSQSLFELAKENSVCDEIEVQAKSLYNVIKDSQDFSTFIKDPTGSGKLIKFNYPLDLRSAEEKMQSYPFVGAAGRFGA